MTVNISCSTLSLLKRKAQILWLFIPVILVLSACDDSEYPTELGNDATVHTVVIGKVEHKTLPVRLPVPGTVVAKDRLMIASRITGFIESITVDEGDIVEPGDVLVEIDNAQVEAAIKGAEAAVLAAKADLLDAEDDVKRIEKLVQSKTVAEDELRNAKVRRAQAKATLATANAEVIAKQQDRRYSRITSQVHAQVRERLRDPGDLAAAGSPILQLDVLGAMELEAHIPSTRISDISVGQSVDVQVEACNKLLESTVTNIVRSADEVTRRYKVRLLLPPNEELTPGQFGQAQFVLGDEKVTVIPDSAITERAGIEGVFIVDSTKTLYFRSVRLGKSWNDLREVLSGLQTDTSIVITPSVALREGDKVK